MNKLDRELKILEASLKYEVYVAEVHSPEHLKLWLYWTGSSPKTEIGDMFHGWALVISRYDSAGDEQPYRDHWELHYEFLVPYLYQYVDKTTTWFWEGDNTQIDIFMNHRLLTKRRELINLLWDHWDMGQK